MFTSAIEERCVLIRPARVHGVVVA